MKYSLSSVALSALFVFGLSCANAEKSLPEPFGHTPEEAALKGLEVFKNMSRNTQTYAINGFGSMAEVDQVQLGSAFMTYWLDCKAFTPESQGKSLPSLVIRSQVAMMVKVKGKGRSILYLDSLPEEPEGHAGEGHWVVTGMGDARLTGFFNGSAGHFAQARGKRERDFLVKAPGAGLMLRATGLDPDDQVFALGPQNDLPCLGKMSGPQSWAYVLSALATCQEVQAACNTASQMTPPPDLIKTPPMSLEKQ